MDLIGRSAEAENLRVVADRHVYFVLAGGEEESVAGRAKLAGFLDGEDLIDLRLNGRGGHGRIEDEDVGAEIRLGCGRGGGEDEQQ